MTESVSNEKRIARRTILSGAVMLGGGAAISAAVPSLALTAADAAIASSGQLAPIAGSGLPGNTAGAAESTAGRMKFSREFLSNKVFQDLALNFDRADVARVDSKLLETGAVVQPNGDILFRIFAPQAKDVTLKFQLVRDGQLVLKKNEEGVFEGLLGWEEDHTGPMNVVVYVDGMDFLYPQMPIHWSTSRPRNFIEVPDTDMEFMLIKDVPHGAMSREIFWADAIQSWERCGVYTPPGYMKSSREYPVLYLQHGGGENELVWGYCGRVAHILDNLIAAGKAEPFIVVMNNGMLRYSGNPSTVIDDALERILIESCIPHIEKNYRVKTGKWNRTISGLSMGCMQTCDIAFRHPELFGNLGSLNASMTHDRESFNTTYERPYPKVLKDREKFARDYKVYFRSTIPVEDHFDYFLADDKLCADAGIDTLPGYRRIVYPKRTSRWNGWRMGLRDFAQMLFKA